MARQEYDVIVIGGGPGGYLAAIRAAQLGMNAACIEERDRLGGTCLNVGCIPSKALLHSTGLFRAAQETFSRHGVGFAGLNLDLHAMMAQKEEAVQALTKGVDQLFHKYQISHVKGRARLTGGQRVEVRPREGPARLMQARHIILATGSVPIRLPDVEIDEQRILSSTGALSLTEVPAHLVIVGAGYIGLEMGSIWSRLGAEVTGVELLNQVAQGMDGELARHLRQVLEKQRFSFRLGAKLNTAVVDGSRVTCTIELGQECATESLSCSHLLIAVGRRPYTEDLGLDEAGVAVDDKGFITVDRRFQTTAPGIFAVGDVVGRPMLAHKAYDEALACVDGIAGRMSYVGYDTIPAIIYTSPEAAVVGRTEEELQQQGAQYRVGRFPYRANSRARCMGEVEGFVKILADAESDLILGAHILGPDAGTTIHELAAAIKFGVTAEDLGRMSHGHPTLSEAVREAALAVHGRAFHI